MDILKALLVITGSSIFFRLGGWGGTTSGEFIPTFLKTCFGIKKGSKWYRWLMGLFIGYFYSTLFTVITYFIATSVLGYGENHWLRKSLEKALGRLGRDLAWCIYGFGLGMAIMPVLGLNRAILQGIITSIMFYLLMKWSNDGIKQWKDEKGEYKLDHAFVELGIGAICVCLTLLGR